MYFYNLKTHIFTDFFYENQNANPSTTQGWKTDWK
jgi:hypothetical protein